MSQQPCDHAANVDAYNASDGYAATAKNTLSSPEKLLNSDENRHHSTSLAHLQSPSLSAPISGLNFTDLPRLTRRPANVPPSDEERLRALECVHTKSMNSLNPEFQLIWAQNILTYAAISAVDNQITASDAHTGNSSLRVRPETRQDAMNIVLFLASQHHPRAEYMKGTWLEFGKFGNICDKPEAFRCYKRAAARGFARAEYRLGMQYESTNQKSLAIQHYKAGEAAGDAASCYRTGMMALLGQLGHTPDYETAMRLIRQSANAADENAPQGAYVYGMLLAKELPQIVIPEAYLSPDLVSARYYIEKAAYLGFSKAQLKMGSAYELCTLSCEFSPLVSLHYNALAAQRGEADAQMSISRWLLCGYEGIFAKNEELAFQFAQSAACRGLSSAKFAMGYFFEVGLVVAMDLDVARYWYEEAAQDGNVDACERLEGLSQAHILSRRDHDKVAVTRIKSRHSSRKGQGVDRPKGSKALIPPVPLISSMLVAQVSTTQLTRMELNTRSSNAAPRNGTIESPEMSNISNLRPDIAAGPEPSMSSTTIDMSASSSKNERASRTVTPSSSAGGFLNLDLDQVPFSAMVRDRLDVAAARYCEDRYTTVAMNSNLEAAGVYEYRPTYPDAGSSGNKIPSPQAGSVVETFQDRNLHCIPTPAQDISLSIRSFSTPEKPISPLDLSRNTEHRDPVRISSTQQNDFEEVDKNSSRTTGAKSVHSVVGKTPQYKQRNRPLPPSSSPLPQPKMSSTPGTPANDSHGFSSLDTPRLFTQPQTRSENWHRQSIPVRPLGKGPQTFEEMGVPIGKHENECVLM